MGIITMMMRICIPICTCIHTGQCTPTDGTIPLHVVLDMEASEDGVLVLEEPGLVLVEVLRRLLVGLVHAAGVQGDVLPLLEGVVVVVVAEGEVVAAVEEEEEEEGVEVVEVVEAAAEEEVDESSIIYCLVCVSGRMVREWHVWI
jgi:hypothetical protein